MTTYLYFHSSLTVKWQIFVAQKFVTANIFGKQKFCKENFRKLLPADYQCSDYNHWLYSRCVCL